MKKSRLTDLRGLIAATVLLGAIPAFPQSNLNIYADALTNGWADWSWATVNLANATPVHSGSKSISVTAGAWTALWLHHVAFNPSGFTNLTFWINGGAGGQLLQVQAILNSSAADAGVQLAPLPTNGWRQINLPLSSLIPPGLQQIDGFWIQDRSGKSQQVFYVDDVLLNAGAAPPLPTNASVTVTVDAAANRHSINPEIYGVAFASSNQLGELNATLNRSGGNSMTRYNWQTNANNRGSDWYFESIASGDPTAGADGDDTIAQSKAAGAQAMLTIPMIGWVAKLGSSRSIAYSYSIAKYGLQTEQDPWLADAGNGVALSSGQDITNNDPNDANLPAGTNFQSGWVSHLTNRWGAASSGGLRYYLLDNEPSIWHGTHRDVYPIGERMQEERDKSASYSTMIKDIDPNAIVAGPEEWGWSGYFFSGYDQQWGGQHGWGSLPDRAANGGWDYLPWYLDQMRQKSTAAGRRLLDVFTVHWYPQSGEYGDSVWTSMQLIRNRSTRSLWDTNYVDQSWINDKVMLVRRLKNWVASYYPGTRVGITEYSWGADAHINGAIAQADVLGIFGRENLDLATRWTVPNAGTPAYNAIKMYRNYDGNKSAFGDISVSAAAPNPDNLSAFAAIRTNDSALTIMVVNKDFAGITPFVLNITNAAGNGTAQAWQLTSANTLTRLVDIPVANGSLNTLLPPQSITLFVIPGLKTFQLRLGVAAPPGQLELWLDGQAGQSYVFQLSPDLRGWVPFSTNTPASNSFLIFVPTTNSPSTFYRGLLNSP